MNTLAGSNACSLSYLHPNVWLSMMSMLLCSIKTTLQVDDTICAQAYLRFNVSTYRLIFDVQHLTQRGEAVSF